MKLIVGLGNPGSRYERTRHNAGFCVLDLIGTELGAEFKAVKDFEALLSKTKFKNEDLILLKPITYMNLSGVAVSKVMRWFKIESSDMLVIHDDVSLPMGKIRVQKNGGAGGQHGVESIIECLSGERHFDRIKIGVGPDPGGERRADFVLQEVNECDRELFQDTLALARKAARSWLAEGADVTANRYNGKKQSWQSSWRLIKGRSPTPSRKTDERGSVGQITVK
jgi:PTH1 family peptidyl-tRNA hydrolase